MTGGMHYVVACGTPSWAAASCEKDAGDLPSLFKAAAIALVNLAKWHLGDNYPYRPQDRGFDTTVHLGGGGVGQTPDVWGNDYFDDVVWAGDELKPMRGYCTDVYFNAASQFIDAHKDKPFFCYLAPMHRTGLPRSSSLQAALPGQGHRRTASSFYA